MRRALAVASVLALALPATAFGHARFLFSTPADGQVLHAAPRALVVHFDDRVTVGPGIAAVDATGRSLLRGTPSAHGRTLTIPLRTSRDRTYDVRWSVVSDDGHDVTGVAAFTVRGASLLPQTTLTAGSSNPAVSNVAERWLFFAGALVAAGAALFLLSVTSTRRVTLIAAAAFAAATLGALLERAGVPGSTRFAHAMTVAAIAAAAGTVLAAVDLRRVLVVPALVLLAAPVVGGHAFDDGVPRIQAVVDFLHLAGAGAWTGGLAALTSSIGSARRFSRLVALPAVVVIALTGLLRAISELTHVSQLWSTGYGRAILVKSALFLLLLGLGYLARSRLLGNPAVLRRSVVVELTLLAGLVVAVAFLTALPPGRALATAHAAPPSAASGPAPAPPHGVLTLAAHTGSDAVAIAVRRNDTRLEVTAIVLNNQGNGADGLSVSVNGADAARCGFGCYRASVGVAPALRVRVNNAVVSFGLPPLPAPDGRALLARIATRFLQTRSVRFHERLSSGPGQTVVSDWRIAAPSSLSFQASDGSSGIIIAGRRWDRQNGGRWVESPQAPQVPQPQLPWAAHVDNVRVLPSASGIVRVSFVDPATPAWFTVSADRTTMRLRRIEMVAPAHFMQDTYRAYDEPSGIAPPRRG